MILESPCTSGLFLCKCVNYIKKHNIYFYYELFGPKIGEPVLKMFKNIRKIEKIYGFLEISYTSGLCILNYVNFIEKQDIYFNYELKLASNGKKNSKI